VFKSAVTPRLSVAAYLRDPSSTEAFGDTKLTLNTGTGIKAPSISQELSSLYTLVQMSGSQAVVPGLSPDRPRAQSQLRRRPRAGLLGRPRARPRVVLRQSVFGSDRVRQQERAPAARHSRDAR
jgi:hypothetical protein